MKKILIHYNYILHYRKAFFNVLSKDYDVTVIHSGTESITDNDKYKEIIVPVKKVGPFYLQSGVIEETKSSEYDIIIALFDVRWVNTILSIFFSKNKKFIWWGAWITKSKIANLIRIYLSKKSDANVFYTYGAMKDFIEHGINSDTAYVANNTFDVGSRIKSYENKIKNRILFVGSLDKRKQNDVLIRAFKNIVKDIDEDIILTIIGDGLEKNNLTQQVQEASLKDRVEFVGRVNDPQKLAEYYKESIVSVSFGQAGLSVLQGLGFGVPFLTKANAISGGEISNIKNRYNGILCEDDEKSLENELLFLCNNIDFSRQMGENAYNYYNEFCTIENMVQGFKDAIEDTKLAKVDKR